MKFNLRFLFIALFICTISIAQNKGTISGVLTDKEMNNEALPFANILIKGTNISTNTDIDGKYKLSVNPGTYTVIFSFVGYETVEKPVTVKANETVTVNQVLSSGGYTLQDVVVKSASGNREKETALLLEQKNAVVIKQSIGAQEMSRKGVSDVEEGLTKVTGISKVESRGLFVRGLEDRYNNLLINDLQAPSNSPFKKIIPLDLFPTDIVGVLNVYKTFNPNISGDFAGATINIETAQPRTSITKITTGFGYTTGNNGKDFLISENANTTQGFLGFLAKDRELPSLLGAVPSAKTLTPNEYNQTSEKNNWNIDKSSSPINNSIGFLHGEKFNFKNNDNLTYLLSINGDNSYQIRSGVERTFNQGQGNYDNDLFTTKYNYVTTFSALAGLKYKAKRFGVAVNSFLLRSTSSLIQDQLGYTNSLSTRPNILIRLNQFEESLYWNNQIFADYSITEDNRHSIKTGISYVKTSFQQPDRKTITGEKINDTEILTTYGGNNLIRQYLDVSGDNYYSGMLEYNFKFKENENNKSDNISVGYNLFNNEEVSSYRFLFGRSSKAPYVTNINDISDNIANDVNNNVLSFKEESNPDYESKLTQTSNAGYVTGLFNFGEKIQLNAGIRIENFLREIEFRKIGASFGDPFEVFSDEKLNFLPSLNVKYSVNETNNVRFAASKTLTRPASMELLPIQYVNPDGTVELGNYPLARTLNLPIDQRQSLQDSENINIDLKYEIFPNAKELIAIGVFGKQIKNPIERLFIANASSGGQITTYDNSKKATLYGAEIEVLLQLSRIAPALDNFSFGFNTSLMKTEVTVDFVNNPLENNAKRDLQGAAEWLINSDIKYDFQFNEEMKNSISLVYSVSGDRIYAVGTAGLDNIYEKPFSKLDFIWTSKLSKNIEAKFAVDNILNPYFKRELGPDSKINITETDLTLKEFKRGTGFSLNLSYTF